MNVSTGTRARGRRATLLVLVALVATVAGCWRQPGYGPLRQGSNPLEAQLTAANVATLTEAWTAEVDDGGVRSDPVVSGRGLVHVSDDRAAYGLDPAAGARAWRADVVPATTPPEAHAGPVSSDDDTVHVPWSGVPDDGGTVELDAATGALVRRHRGNGEQSIVLRGDWRVTEGTGFVEDTLAWAGVRVDGPAPWALLTDLGGTELLRGPTSAAVTADRFLVGLDASYYGANVVAGWRLDRDCSQVNQPVDCLPDARTQLDGAPVTPVVADGEATAYVATDAGTVYAFDVVTGDVRWTAALGSPVTHRLAWTPDALYAVTTGGELVALDPDGCGAATCTPTWRTPLAGAPAAPPAVAGGVVYVASAGGTIEAFPAAGPTGVGPLWEDSVPGEVTGGPTVALGTLFVGTSRGRVVAYRPPRP